MYGKVNAIWNYRSHNATALELSVPQCNAEHAQSCKYAICNKVYGTAFSSSNTNCSFYLDAAPQRYNMTTHIMSTNKGQSLPKSTLILFATRSITNLLTSYNPRQKYTGQTPLPVSMLKIHNALGATLTGGVGDDMRVVIVELALDSLFCPNTFV